MPDGVVTDPVVYKTEMATRYQYLPRPQVTEVVAAGSPRVQRCQIHPIAPEFDSPERSVV